MSTSLVPVTADTLTVQTIGNEPRILDTDLADRLEMTRTTNIRQVIEQNRDELESFGNLHAVNAKSGKRGNDNALTVQTIENEPRILDTDLAERLGFTKPTNIRNLINRHEAPLAALGVVFAVQITSGAKGGRPGTAYYLNKRQAIFITTQSGTAAAVEVTLEVITRFDAYEKAANTFTALPDFSDPVAAARAWADAEEAKRVAQQRAQIAQQRVIELQPKADFVDQYITADGSLSSRDAGKVFGVSAQRFNATLKAHGIFFKGQNTPRQQYVDDGWFKVNAWTRYGATGTQTRVTPLGMTKLAPLFVDEDEDVVSPAGLLITAEA